MGVVLDGCVVLTLEGETRAWPGGENFVIGDQEEHSAVLDPGTYVIEIFQESDRHRALE
jgi:hypothetical protein